MPQISYLKARAQWRPPNQELESAETTNSKIYGVGARVEAQQYAEAEEE